MMQLMHIRYRKDDLGQTKLHAAIQNIILHTKLIRSHNTNVKKKYENKYKMVLFHLKWAPDHMNQHCTICITNTLHCVEMECGLAVSKSNPETLVFKSEKGKKRENNKITTICAKDIELLQAKILLNRP